MDSIIATRSQETNQYSVKLILSWYKVLGELLYRYNFIRFYNMILFIIFNIIHFK